MRLLVDLQQEYIALLEDEINKQAGFMLAHGIQSTVETVQRGVNLREQISKARALPYTPYTVAIWEDQGTFVGQVLEVPGAVSQGNTEDDLMEQLHNAIAPLALISRKSTEVDLDKNCGVPYTIKPLR